MSGESTPTMQHAGGVYNRVDLNTRRLSHSAQKIHGILNSIIMAYNAGGDVQMDE
jgi:hypothetical protein